MTLPESYVVVPPLVAIVGRPNVGKSTLFNRLVKARMALVDDQPGVTRDRLYGEAYSGGRMFRVVDTGGFDQITPVKRDPIMSQVVAQAELAIDEADLILFLLDGVDGLRPADQEVLRLLRRSGKPVLAVVNKLDHVNHADRVADFYELGLPLLGVSAEHSRGMSDLWDAIAEQIELPTVDMLEQDSGPIPVAEDEPESVSRVEWKKAPIRVAVVGRPNVGKSSLVNTLLGEERLLATPVAGTTRDPIDVELRAEVDGEEHKFIFVDTAGIRRKRSVADRVEQFSVMAALRSIERADVVLVVLDGAARPSEQDMRIATLAHEKGKGLVLVANKWDLVENPEWAEGFPKAVRLDLAFATYAPLLLISAKTGRNTQKLFGPIVAAQRERHRRISTGALNRFFHDIVAARPPDFYKGRRAKLFFVSQPLLRPPTFIFACKDPDFIPTSYARFLRNRLREEFGFGGTPIWLKFRPRGRQKNTRESLSLDK